MSRGDPSEAEWRVLKELLPSERGWKSRPAHDNRPIVNGILWHLPRARHERRVRTVTPPRCHCKHVIRRNRGIYRERNRIERMIGRLKINRAVAIRSAHSPDTSSTHFIDVNQRAN